MSAVTATLEPGLRRLQGIVPIINTPFDEQMRVDLGSLERLVDRSVGDGIAGCVVPAVASEVEKLTSDERRRIVEIVVSTIGGRVPVIAGVSAVSLAESRALAEHALDRGCAGILCRVPSRLDDTTGGVVEHFKGLAEVGPDLLMIQDLSLHDGGLPLELIVELMAEIPAFQFLKVETALAGPKYTAVLEATEGRVRIACGWGMLQMIEALDRGVHAFNTTAVNRPFVRIYDCYHQGDRGGAVALFNRLLPVMAWVNQDIGVSIQFFKRYCRRRGEFVTANIRPPGTVYDAYHERIADELIDDLIRLEEKLDEQVAFE